MSGIIDVAESLTSKTSGIYVFLGGCALVLSVVGGVRWYGENQYEKGYAQAVLKAQAEAEGMSEKYRQQEAVAQENAEKKYAEYREQVASTERRAADVGADLARLREQLDTLRRGAATRANTATVADAGARADFIGVIAACGGRYDEVATYAAGLSDQVVGLQDYIRTAVVVEK